MGKLVDADALKKKFVAQRDKIEKEKKYGWEFTAKNKDWKKEESTVCVAFTKMEHWNIPGVWHSGKWHIPAKGEE